MVLLVGPIPS